MNAIFDVERADRAHVWHPYTQHATSALALPIVSAHGAYLRDKAGREIFDAISSWWVTLHGHTHPGIAAAISAQAAQLEQVIFADFTHEPAARLATELVRIAPRGLTRVFYSDDGSTAVEVAIKIALQRPQNAGLERRTIVALERAYHGDTFGAMSVSARSIFTAPFDGLLFDVVRLGDPSETDVAAQLELLIADKGHALAAVIVEPMLLGAGGMRVWPAEMLRAIRTSTSAAGIPLIADEVLTGFGRTGPLFACEYAEIVPDIMCLSKGLTGGFLPMGATLTTERIFDDFVSTNVGHTLFHGHSYTANPLACAAALASIALLDAECAVRRNDITRAHHVAADRFRAHASVQNVRVLGTMVAFELNGGHDYTNSIGASLKRFALERCVLLRPLGNTVYLLPPYCSTASDLARAYAVVEEFLATL
jgi:adenosylmethionine-8-amino-7-oxononanoate aminotransferase